MTDLLFFLSVYGTFLRFGNEVNHVVAFESASFFVDLSLQNPSVIFPVICTVVDMVVLTVQ